MSDVSRSPEKPAFMTLSEKSPGKRWLLPQIDAAVVAMLASELQLPAAIARVLVHRGLSEVKAARAFLTPTLDQLHDPLQMLGMERAVARVQQAVRGREPILIYGDYDVDGTTAVVLLKTAIERLARTGEGVPIVRYHVPHRLREGYGMQAEVLRRAADEGVRLVISVDTGIRAFAAADAAEALGLDLIVTDHHLPEDAAGHRALPKALAVLNPNQAGCGYPCKGLCGAGVAFKLSQALLQAAAGDDVAAREKLATKVLPSFLKMLAIATVADAVPLVGENRAIVALGLEALQQPASPGLRALMEVAQLDPVKKRLRATDVGFRLGPRINAAGRMDVAGDVVELFTTRNPGRAEELAAKLDRLNTDRRQTEALALEEVLAQATTAEVAAARCLVLDGEGWHRGVIGILASRVVEVTGKPALVLAHEAGEAYGSGRSVEGFHLLQALEACADLFTRFGGHAHAVGFSLPSDRVPLLRERLAAYAAVHVREEDLLAPVRCDAELRLDEITPVLYRAIGRLEPFGMDNAEPTFIARGVLLLAEPRYLKERHCKLQLGCGDARFAALGWHWGERVRAMGWCGGERLDVVYRVRENEHPDYGGLELEIVDMRLAAAEVAAG
jgi:single-stranded-DNA-specific exonuclease